MIITMFGKKIYKDLFCASNKNRKAVKEAIFSGERIAHFGRVAMPTSTGWKKILEGSYDKSLSQEHGIIQKEKSIFPHIHVGNLLMIIPAHSCLAVNLLKNEHIIL